MGVPGYANTEYNYFALGPWTCKGSIAPFLDLWTNPIASMGSNTFGSTSKEIRDNLKKNFTNAGAKVLVSAFGGSENPATMGHNATECARSLAKYVNDFDFDGADIFFSDTPSMTTAKGKNWLKTFST